MDSDCPFCAVNVDPAEVVLENPLCLFLQREQPVLKGSGIIIPRAHKRTAFDLSEAELSATFSLLHRAKRILDRRLRPDGYNIGWNIEKTAGQDIFHAHLHVIPRFSDEPLAGKGIRYWIKQSANKRPGARG